MQIKFLESGDSPEIGPYKKGEERDLPADMAHILIQRGMAEEINPVSSVKGEGKTRMKNKEVNDNGRQ